MRTQVLVLLAISVSFTGCATGGRLKYIRTGMTRADVMIQVGKPVEVRAEGETVYWIYPSTYTEVCLVKFIDQVVASDATHCESTEASRKLASDSFPSLEQMNSETEYQGRVMRYCGIRPTPSPGCHVSDVCKNGAWEETCDAPSK